MRRLIASSLRHHDPANCVIIADDWRETLIAELRATLDKFVPKIKLRYEFELRQIEQALKDVHMPHERWDYFFTEHEFAKDKALIDASLAVLWDKEGRLNYICPKFFSEQRRAMHPRPANSRRVSGHLDFDNNWAENDRFVRLRDTPQECLDALWREIKKSWFRCRRPSAIRFLPSAFCGFIAIEANRTHETLLSSNEVSGFLCVYPLLLFFDASIILYRREA